MIVDENGAMGDGFPAWGPDDKGYERIRGDIWRRTVVIDGQTWDYTGKREDLERLEGDPPPRKAAFGGTIGTKKDSGKPRMDLIDPDFEVDLARVLTFGSDKYDPSDRVLDNNWRQGMRWGRVYAAMQRHLSAFWSGEDYDPETGLPHLAHAAFGCMSLHNYMRVHRDLDDRPLSWRSPKKIWLDIDGVIAGWVDALAGRAERMGVPMVDDPQFWSFGFGRVYSSLFDSEDDYKSFLLNEIHPLVLPDDLPFEPCGYVTHRGPDADGAVTRAWLNRWGFPEAPVISVADSSEKADVLLANGADIFVDDKFSTFVECNRAGVLTYLMSRPWNERADVGGLRIRSLDELAELYVCQG